MKKEKRNAKVYYGGEDYHERQTWFNGKINHLCVQCRTVFKQERGRDNVKCPSCGEIMKYLGMFAKAPKKNASESVWRKFLKKNYIEKE